MVATRSGETSAEGAQGAQATNGGGDNAADVACALKALEEQNEELLKITKAQGERVKELEDNLAADALRRVDIGGVNDGAAAKFLGKPPKFSGTDKSLDVREWLQTMKFLMAALKITDETAMVAFCCTYLDSKARSH